MWELQTVKLCCHIIWYLCNYKEGQIKSENLSMSSVSFSLGARIEYFDWNLCLPCRLYNKFSNCILLILVTTGLILFHVRGRWSVIRVIFFRKSMDESVLQPKLLWIILLYCWIFCFFITTDPGSISYGWVISYRSLRKNSTSCKCVCVCIEHKFGYIRKGLEMNARFNSRKENL